jgi:hypothetical protein
MAVEASITTLLNGEKPRILEMKSSRTGSSTIGAPNIRMVQDSVTHHPLDHGKRPKEWEHTRRHKQVSDESVQPNNKSLQLSDSMKAALTSHGITNEAAESLMSSLKENSSPDFWQAKVEDGRILFADVFHGLIPSILCYCLESKEPFSQLSCW